MVEDARNAYCFEQPHWLVIARGMRPEDWFENDTGQGTGGIAFPKSVHLHLGNRYYRFANSTTSKDAQIGGGWWIEFEQFHKIETFAKQNGLALSYAARLFLALPYDWTRVDRLVSAILKVPLKAYAGVGMVAVGSSRVPNNVWTPIQQQRVTQLYIPGLYVKGHKPPLYTVAFPQPKVEYIHGNRRQV